MVLLSRSGALFAQAAADVDGNGAACHQQAHHADNVVAGLGQPAGRAAISLSAATVATWMVDIRPLELRIDVHVIGKRTVLEQRHGDQHGIAGQALVGIGRARANHQVQAAIKTGKRQRARALRHLPGHTGIERASIERGLRQIFAAAATSEADSDAQSRS